MNTEQPLRLALVAGELSGDTLGAGLLDELHRRGIDVDARGIGGPGMQSAGMSSWWQAEDIAVMGLAEVLKHLPRLLALKRQLLQRIRAFSPHAFIGIDLPDFNLRVARELRSSSLQTLQYVSPSVWAWRPKRVYTIAAAIDRVLCLLPFEPEFYRAHDVAADFVGHPLADDIQPETQTHSARQRLSLSELASASEAPVYALLPGSRGAEVRTLAPLLLDAAQQIRREQPNARFITALAGTAAAAHWADAVATHTNAPTVTVCKARASEVIAASDVAVLASGTVALEALLVGRPIVMTYKLSALTGWLVTRFNLMHVDYYSLPNLLTDSMDLGVFVPELVQDDARPDKIAGAAVQQFLTRRDPKRIAAFDRVREVLSVDANKRAADALLACVRPVASLSV